MEAVIRVCAALSDMCGRLFLCIVRGAPRYYDTRRCVFIRGAISSRWSLEPSAGLCFADGEHFFAA